MCNCVCIAARRRGEVGLEVLGLGAGLDGMGEGRHHAWVAQHTELWVTRESLIAADAAMYGRDATELLHRSSAAACGLHVAS